MSGKFGLNRARQRVEIRQAFGFLSRGPIPRDGTQRLVQHDSFARLRCCLRRRLSLLAASRGASAAAPRQGPAGRSPAAAPVYADSMTARSTRSTAAIRGAISPTPPAEAASSTSATPPGSPPTTPSGLCAGLDGDGKLTDRALALIARHRAGRRRTASIPTVYRDAARSASARPPRSLDDACRAPTCMLSQAIVTYARQAHAGRLDPAAISANIDYKPHLPDPAARCCRSSPPPTTRPPTLAAYNPTHPEFAALRDQARRDPRRSRDRDSPPVVAGRQPSSSSAIERPARRGPPRAADS